jgi:hypothetical protein
MRTLISAIVTLLVATPLAAQTVTLQQGRLPNGNAAPSFSFNTANAVRTVGVSGTASALTGGLMADFHGLNVDGPSLPPAGLRATSLRCVLDGPASSACTSTSQSARFIELNGQNDTRGVLTVGWGNDDAGNRLGVVNGNGFDLFALEWANNEGYVARFQTFDGLWTNWGYTPGQIGYGFGTLATDYYAWLTRFDFSDYGLGLGAFVVAAEFQNVIVAEGFVNPQTNNAFTKGSIQPFATRSDVTPDMFYVGGINNITAVPEPSSIVLVALGAAGLFAMKRRRVRS